jgi:hypothetical protein
MLNVTIVPNGTHPENDLLKRDIEIQEMCKVKEGQTLD